MCGITGVFGEVDKETLSSMTDVISHRGPDDKGMFLDKDIGLGHRRLSIIDLAKGKQPMFDNEGRYVIVFNGEIYNFKFLKKQLEEKGVHFRTDCDTEVILYMYKLYGKECLKYLNGMFSFAIYDSFGKSLFIARDRLGIKPLYYFKKNDLLVFSSEIKSILEYPGIDKEIDKNSVYEFLFRQYVAAPDTVFKNILKLEAGHYIYLKEGQFEKKRYWDLGYSETVEDEEVAINKVKELLENSVKRRLIADVPLGAFLSGGVDSSIIVHLMKKFKGDGIKTFSVGFEEKEFDETKYARLVSEKFNTDHQEIILNSSHMKLLDKVIYHLDEPLSDFAALPTYLLSEFARKKVKVVLTGEGGDENFGGYNYYKQFLRLNKLLPKKVLYNKKMFAYKNMENYLRKDMFGNSSVFLKSKLVGGKFGRGNFLNQMLKWDTQIWLPDDLLMKVDKMTMAASLEARVPFLDHKFMEFNASLHPRFKSNKYILKKAFKNNLPKEVFSREKHGFDVPVNLWFNSVHKERVDTLVEENKEIINKYFDFEVIKKMLNEKRDNLFLWRLYNFIVWHKRYI